MKSQVVVDKTTKEIISVIQGNGKKHDYRLFNPDSAIEKKY
ncbi:MAG: hypothetical protein IPI59_04545 [Sphingobacteriales bacterium]|nr:hypothetical protein [Sphingobacteriales bacterium]MBP9142533.1 hypothetical protein [Chitinophagales bacterium]MBK6891347.1 hypothetical protein [Sphingobacteriales bacterium]MBK7526821.1 hypothetical protein [Sphingobacteriales bacterium]MBK8677313.1 hypothetical protein [Sphingobacteriales bacterium]